MTDDVRQKLDSIIRLINDGRVDDAEAMCRGALEAQPDEVNLVALMGAVLMKKGALESAEEHLRRAIEIEPAFARPHEDLGALLLSRKKPEEAIPHFKKAMAIDPAQPTAVRGLASALQRAGREDEANSIRRELMQGLPTEKLLAEAEALCSKGDTSEAEQICDVVLRRDPEDAGALRVLALAATTDERFIIAESYLKRILRLAPDDVGAFCSLGKFLSDRGRYPEAVELMRSATVLVPDSAEVQLLLANMFGIIGQTDNAMQAYEQCLKHNPDDTSALIGRGHMLRIAGRQDEAQASYRRCVELCPEIGTAWWYLASFPRFAATDQEIATMRAQSGSGNVTADSAVGFNFALARAFEQRNDFDAAWEQYTLGNAGKRALVKYDPVKAELELGKIRATFTADLFSQVKPDNAAEVTPIFILGMPRSGSTLIEQILASHSQVEGTGELPYILMMTNSMITKEAGCLHYTELVNYLPAEEFTRLGRNYLANADSHRVQGKPFFTDKMPPNFAHIGLIRLLLPQAKFIDARREPLAACVANYRQLFALGKNQSYDLTELGEYYVQYTMIMDHWDNVMPGAVLRVQYEDVVADLDNQVRRILEFCGLPFEAACLEYHKSERLVNTASAEQVREPIYDSAVEFWRNYESQLDELREVLAPVL